MAALLTPEGPGPGALRDELAGFDLAIAYTRNVALIRNLGGLVPRLLAHDPQPCAPGGHASEWLAQPLGAIGITADAPPPPCVASREETEAALPHLAALGRGFVAVHPGSGSPEKCWPPARFASLIAAVAADRPWLLVEGPADASSVAPLAGIPGMRRARELPTRVLGALLSQAGLYVGNDSGVSHLAAAWAAPTLALFGPTDPTVWAPQGPRVSLLRSPSRAMKDVTVESVLEAARGLASADPAGT